MSTLTADPGFARGQVLGITKTYYDAQVGDGSHITGVEKVFLDTDPRSQIVTSNHTVTCIAAKNTSGAPLLPGTVVQFKSSAILTEVEPATEGTGKLVGVVDEYLPAAGAPDGEVFWVVVDGPTAAIAAADLTNSGGVKATGDKVTTDSSAVGGFALADAVAGDKARVLVNFAGRSQSVGPQVEVAGGGGESTPEVILRSGQYNYFSGGEFNIQHMDPTYSGSSFIMMELTGDALLYAQQVGTPVSHVQIQAPNGSWVFVRSSTGGFATYTEDYVAGEPFPGVAVIKGGIADWDLALGDGSGTQTIRVVFDPDGATPWASDPFEAVAFV